MMRHVLKPLAVAVAACACCSCARTESENFNEIEDKALDIWVSSNAPDAEPLGDTGMYYEVIEALPDGSATKVDVRGRWVDVKYVIRDLNGDIVYNRNEETARLLGTFTKYTHYIPDRLYIASRQDLSDIPFGHLPGHHGNHARRDVACLYPFASGFRIVRYSDFDRIRGAAGP